MYFVSSIKKFATAAVFSIGLLMLSVVSSAANYQVKMLDSGPEGKMVFEPAVLRVDVGDSVTFVPTDSSHDSISVFTPPGANSWHGKRGQKITVTINKEGVYLYKCAPHYYYGMFGVIYAGNPTNLGDAKLEATKHSQRFVTHKNRLDAYLARIK